MRIVSSLRGALGGSGAPGGYRLESGETRTSIPFNDGSCRLVVSQLPTSAVMVLDGLGGAAYAFYKRQQLLPIDGLCNSASTMA